MPSVFRACSLALSVACAAVPAVRAQSAPKPTLVVLITIDQFRGDYLTRFNSQLTGGLGRLARGGAWYTNAHHDHALTETAPGHATVLSGRFPRSTGITANRVGVEDEASPLIFGAVGPGASPRRFQGTTLVDWLRSADSRSRAFSVSTKDRAAILPIGRSKSDVYWYDITGLFTTSHYYRDSLPPWVVAFNNRHMAQQYTGRTWNLLLPDSAYHEADSVAFEGNGTFFTFPHELPDDAETSPSAMRGTPFIDELTLAFALHGVQSLSLGKGPQTDLVSISLSATDFIGHRYGPDSREIHDDVLRLDRMLGMFLDSLYRMRDSAHITIALTGDHGAGTMPELAPASMQPRPTRVTLLPVIKAVRQQLRKAKVDTLAVDFDQQIIGVDRTAFERAHVNADSTLRGLATVIRQIPGVARVDRFRDLLADSATDVIARRWSHQLPANSAAELVITLTPLSLWGTLTSSHGSPYDYDSNVPIIFYGAGIRRGVHGEFVRTVDLAPTLAAVAGVAPTERLDGVVLRSALP